MREQGREDEIGFGRGRRNRFIGECGAYPQQIPHSDR